MPTIALTMPDGDAEAYVAPAPDGRPAPGVLFIVDAIGLRPQIERMADRIASWGYTVLVPHVFHRDGAAADLAPRGDLREPEERKAFMGEAMSRVQRLTPDLVARDLQAYLSALRSRPEVAGEEVGVTGYCMGARIAVRAAGLDAGVVAAAAGTAVGSSPARPTARTSPSRRLAQPSPSGTPTRRLDAARGRRRPRRLPSRRAVAPAVNEVFPGPHGYSMADTSSYDEESAERHFDSLRGRCSTRTLER